MLDVQNPEIKVDDIMQRIQEKVRLQREHAASAPPGTSSPVGPGSSLMFSQLLEPLRATAQVGAALPPMSRTHGVKRKAATLAGKAFLRMAQLITRDQRAFNQAVVEALQALVDQVVPESKRTASRVDELAGKQAAGAQRLDDLDGRLRALEAKTAALDAESAAGRKAQGVRIEELRIALSLQERRLTLLLEEARKRLPAPLDKAQLEAFAGELPHVADAGYLAFEDAFRGSREEIKRRVSVYVPRLRAAEAGSASAPILDLGCGRGELLEVLRDEGLKASGVDSNAAAVDKCRELNLDVSLADAFEALHRIPDGSLGALAALHFVEHIPFPLVLKLLDETLRVLRPGGIAIFETPNPRNILVGASTFYLDPTHRNPVHPQTLQYLAEARGLVGVETMALHPYPSEMRVPEDTPIGRFFNEHFLGPQDYAVLGRRA
jgi:SAM-dependent methyltransferase